MYRPIFRIVTVLYFWNQSQCDFFHMLLDVSKPHPPTSQLVGFSIGVRNDPRKIFIIKTMDFNSIQGSYKRDKNIKISTFLIKRD